MDHEKSTMAVEYKSVRLRSLLGIGKVVTDINPQEVSSEVGILGFETDTFSLETWDEGESRDWLYVLTARLT